MKNEIPKDIWVSHLKDDGYTGDCYIEETKEDAECRLTSGALEYTLKSHSDAEIAKLSENYSYVWRWVERAIWCKDLRESAISCLKHTPYAPWNDEKVEWDTAHKEYDDDIKATQSEIAKRDECIKELVEVLKKSLKVLKNNGYSHYEWDLMLTKHKQTIEGVK